MIQAHIQEAGGVFGPFQVTAHPIQIVCDTRKHCSATFPLPELRIKDPRILAPTPLRGVDDQRAALEGDARQSTWYDSDLIAIKDEGAEIDVARHNLSI